MSRLFKRTKILATIGPSVFSEEKITELIMAGANGCRLNFSHGSYEERDEQIQVDTAQDAVKWTWSGVRGVHGSGGGATWAAIRAFGRIPVRRNGGIPRARCLP